MTAAKGSARSPPPEKLSLRAEVFMSLDPSWRNYDPPTPISSTIGSNVLEIGRVGKLVKTRGILKHIYIYRPRNRCCFLPGCHATIASRWNISAPYDASLVLFKWHAHAWSAVIIYTITRSQLITRSPHVLCCSWSRKDPTVLYYIYIYTSIHNNSTRRPIDRQQIKLQGFKERRRRRYDECENQVSLSEICIVGFNFWNQKDQLKFELPSIGSGSVLSSLVQ